MMSLKPVCLYRVRKKIVGVQVMQRIARTCMSVLPYCFGMNTELTSLSHRKNCCVPVREHGA